SVASEATQASFISNFLNTWSSFGYTGPSFIYTTRDRNTASTNAQDTFGVLRTDWTRKPAANVIQQWTATHPQSPPSSVTLAATTDTAATTSTMSTMSTTTAVAPMAATEVPQSTVTTSSLTAETSTAPTATATPTAAATSDPTAS